MRKHSAWIASLLTAATFCAGSSAQAAVLTFTWDPAGASPVLAAAGSGFTADAISVGNYLYAPEQPDFSFTIDQLLPVTGFSLNGAPVTAPGLGSSYGLYFEITGGGFEPGGVPSYSALNLALKADPGNLDGLPVATATGIGFTNTGATGAADDFVLATGSLLAASLAFNPVTHVRNLHLDETFLPASGEGGFFITPSTDISALNFQLTTNPDTFTAVPGVVNYVNGAFGTAQFVPEPASLALLGAGLFGVVSIRRMTNRSSFLTKRDL